MVNRWRCRSMTRSVTCLRSESLEKWDTCTRLIVFTHRLRYCTLYHLLIISRVSWKAPLSVKAPQRTRVAMTLQGLAVNHTESSEQKVFFLAGFKSVCVEKRKWRGNSEWGRRVLTILGGDLIFHHRSKPSSKTNWKTHWPVPWSKGEYNTLAEYLRQVLKFCHHFLTFTSNSMDTLMDTKNYQHRPFIHFPSA